MKRTITIYAITRSETGHSYVGSTVNRGERWNAHKSQLRGGKHHCRHLQNAWSKYGEPAFQFSVIEQIEADHQDRLIAELAWIRAIGHYNSLISSDTPNHFAVRPEERERRREAALQRIASDPALQAALAERGRAVGAYMQSPEGRARAAISTAERWQKPAERAKLAKGLENRWADPNARAHMSEKTGARMRTNEGRKSHSEKLKAAWQDPEKAARLRARLEKRWADPEAKARHSERMKRQWAAKRAAKAAAEG